MIFPKPTSPYAYAFLMAGCDPYQVGGQDNHDEFFIPSYHYMLYSILVATHSLQQFGSTANVLLFVEMYYDSNATKLPDIEEEWLHRKGVQIKYLPKQSNQYFYRTQLDKFRILKLTQYRRIMYLDMDILPLANLDYLFHLSDPLHTETPSVLEENVAIEGVGAPLNGGAFILAPHHGDIEEIQMVIEQKEQQPEFNLSVGWGHVIQESEGWVQPSEHNRSRTEWKFYAAPGDQGLLLFWTMYNKKKVSVIYRRTGIVKNFGPHPVGGKTTVVKEALQDPFTKLEHAGVIPKPIKCWMDCMYHPFKDMVHFIASRKPWVAGLPLQFLKLPREQHRMQSPVSFWFSTLQELNAELQMGIDLVRMFPDRSKQKPVHRHSGLAVSRKQLAGVPMTNLLDE